MPSSLHQPTLRIIIWFLLHTSSRVLAGPVEYAICQGVAALGCGPVGYATCEAAAATGCVVTGPWWPACYAGWQEVCAAAEGATYGECYASSQGLCAALFLPPITTEEEKK